MNDKHKSKVELNNTVSDYLHASHLYPSKAESLFKCFAFLISWYFGVYGSDSAAVYYLFAMSIITEYSVKLVTTKSLISKLLPLLLIFINGAVFVFSMKQLTSPTAKVNTAETYIAIITVVAIVIDTVLIIIVEPPLKNSTESNISSFSTLPNQEPGDNNDNT